MARTAEGDPKEREILRVLGRQIEEPVDSIVEAAVQDFAIVDLLFQRLPKLKHAWKKIMKVLIHLKDI